MTGKRSPAFSRQTQAKRRQRKKRLKNRMTRTERKEEMTAVNKFFKGQALSEKQIAYAEKYFLRKLKRGTVNTKRDALWNLHVLDPKLENPKIRELTEKRAKTDESPLVQKTAREILNRSRQKKEKRA